MTVEINAVKNKLIKTIKTDKRIGDAATCVAVVSTASVFINPFVLIPTALVSGGVAHVAERLRKTNQKKLNDTVI